MNGVNNVIIIGNVGNVSDVIQVSDNAKLVSIAVATTEHFVNTNKDKKSNTQWHTIVLWNSMSDLINIIEKGDLIYVEGRLNYRIKTSENKTEKYTEIVAKTIRVLRKGHTNKEEIKLNNDENDYYFQ